MVLGTTAFENIASLMYGPEFLFFFFHSSLIYRQQMSANLEIALVDWVKFILCHVFFCVP